MIVSTHKKSLATIPAAWVRGNVVHDSARRPGVGSISHFLRIDQTVEAAIVMPTRVSSRWMWR
jgi:hypothetical protein